MASSMAATATRAMAAAASQVAPHGPAGTGRRGTSWPVGSGRVGSELEVDEGTVDPGGQEQRDDGGGEQGRAHGPRAALDDGLEGGGAHAPVDGDEGGDREDGEPPCGVAGAAAAAEHGGEDAEGLVEADGAEEHPREADQDEGGEGEGELDGAGAPQRRGGGGGAEQALGDQVAAVQAAPGDEGPGRAVPEAADQHGEGEVDV